MGTQWAGEVQQYTLDALEGLLIRIYKLQLAGVNADSVRLNASGTDRRLIWQAGGEVLGPASAITARSMTFELHMFKSSNKIENTFDDFNNFPAGQQMWGGSTQAGAGIHGSEMAAYIAKAIYHRDGDTARRDHALRLSLLGFVINLLWSGIPSASPPKPEIGQLSDPHQTQWTTPYLLSTQVVPSPEIRNKHWLHNTFYSIRTLVDGFTDEVPTQISLFGSTDIRIQLSTPTLQDSAVAAQLVGTVEINIVGVADLVPGIPSEEGGIGVFRPPIPNRPIIAVERPANPKNMALRGLVAIGIQPAGDLVIELLLAGEIALNINPVGQLFAALQETFTAADSSAGDIDGDLDWTAMHATPTWRISGNVALFENGPTYATKAMRCEADIGSADIDAVALIGRWDVNTAVDAWCGLIVRMDASAMTGYIAHLHKRANEDAHDVVLWRAVNGTWSALATSAIVANPTIGTTALRVRIKTVGGNPVITVFYEGQQVLEHEDTAANKITTGSRIGLWAGMGPRTATISLGIATVNADVAS
jgi:hypothetical protein